MNNFFRLFIGTLYRSKMTLVLSAVCSAGLALLIVTAIGSAGKDISAVKLGFADMDESAVSADFARYLTEDLELVLLRSDDVETLNTELVEKTISGIVEIPAGFEDALLAGAPEPVMLTFMGDYENEAFTRGYIEAYLSSAASLSAASGGDGAVFESLLAEADAGRVSVETIAKDEGLLKAQTDKDGYRLMVGVFMMFGFMMSISIASLIYSDRTAGSYLRIKAGPVVSFEYAASIAGFGIVLMLVINGPALLLYALSGMDPGIPFGATALLIAVFSLFVIAFGLFAGLTMPSFNGIIGLVTVVTTISSMLGGAWFPLDFAPDIFRVIGRITPQYWFFEAAEAWQTGFSPLLPTLIILLAAALLFVLSGIRFTNSERLVRG